MAAQQGDSTIVVVLPLEVRHLYQCQQLLGEAAIIALPAHSGNQAITLPGSNTPRSGAKSIPTWLTNSTDRAALQGGVVRIKKATLKLKGSAMSKSVPATPLQIMAIQGKTTPSGWVSADSGATPQKELMDVDASDKKRASDSVTDNATVVSQPQTSSGTGS